MGTAMSDLVVRLNAQNRGFNRGMMGSTGVLGKFSGAVSGLGSRLLALGGAGAMGFMIKRQFALIDSTAKLSQQIGVSTERLGGLQHAAELTGAGTDALNRGLSTMTKRLGEAARSGTGPAAMALNDLGLSIQNIAAMRPDAAFTAIADALKNVESVTTRNAVAANLFSKANMGLLNTLALGKGGLADAQREAEKLGKTYTGLDSKSIERANDAITRMKGAIAGLATRSAIAMAPWVETLAGKVIPNILHWGRELTKAGGRLRTVVGWTVKFGAGLLAAKVAIGAVNVVMRTYTMITRGAAAATAFLTALTGPSGWLKLAAGTAAATVAIGLMDSALGDVNAEIARISQATPRATKSIEEIRGLSSAAAGAFTQLETAGGGAVAGLAKLRQEIVGLTDVQRTQQAAALKMSFAIDESTMSYLKQRNATTALVESYGSAQAAMHAYVDAMKAAASPAETLHKRLEQLRQLQALGLPQAAMQQGRRDAFKQFDTAVGGPQEKIDALRNSVLQLNSGLSDAQWAMKRFAELPGATGLQIAAFQKLTQQMKGLQDQDNAINRANKWRQRIETPAERMAKDRREIEDLFQRGKLTGEERARSLASLVESATKRTTDPQGSGFSGAEKKGSQAAWHKIMQAIATEKGGKGDTAKRSERHLADIRQSLAEIRDKEPGEGMDIDSM